MLLDDYARPCVLLIHKRTEGTEGGWKTEWADGDTFTCYQALDADTERTAADQEGLSRKYTALIPQDAALAYNDYFRDELTGYTYRVTSDPSDKESPASASFHLKYFTAEREVPPE